MIHMTKDIMLQVAKMQDRIRIVFAARVFVVGCAGCAPTSFILDLSFAT